MKQYIVKPLIAAAAVLALAACDDNSWNEDYLDGFTTPDNTDVQTVEYTLTDADYAAIASNSTNKALAGDELAAELANVGKLHRFTDKITAEDYLPAFLASTSFSYFSLSDGSAVKVTYNVADALPEELELLNAATSYTLTTEDYQAIYESDENYAEALAPSHTAAASVPGILDDSILAEQFPDAKQGDYVVVNYNWSATDPVFSATPEPETWKPSSVVATIALDEQVTIQGWITGVCDRGIIVTDASGSVFAYNGAGIDVAAYTVGDAYEVTATVSSYNKGFQLDLANATVTKVTDPTATTYEYPAPKVLTGADMDALITRMVGREVSNMFPKIPCDIGETVLEVRGLNSGKQVKNVSFSVRKGEILGFAGLVGAGRTETVETIFGMRHKDSGSVVKDGRELKIESPQDAIREQIALLTEDRRGNGIVGIRSVKDNTILAHLSAYGFPLKHQQINEDTEKYVQAMNTKTPSIDQLIMYLSGGNQQKVLIGRWLLTDPDVLIMDEPTRGIDVGAKAEIHTLISQLAAAGKAIILISSELPEVMGMSDRIVAMYEGEVTGVVERDSPQWNSEHIMALCHGQLDGTAASA